MKKQIRGVAKARDKKALKSRKWILLVGVVVFLAVFYGLAVKNTPESTAVKATDFQAGRIIDDAVFYNSNAMSVAEIQTVLDRYHSNCDMWGTGSAAGRVVNETGYVMPAGSTNREYARKRREAGNSRYHDAPYICLNKYYENPTTGETLYEIGGVVKAGMISAAQIIYNEAQKYNINPQVLITLLKKESYVWGDSWPLKWEYNTPMGYGCPDTASCNPQYFGFYKQTHMAAWQYNYYREHINEYQYRPYRNNNIYYSPTASCGTKTVYIENIATASLYIYTPYTPNDAALRNYPGSAPCGSYGNRNFFMFFSEMWGSTYGKAFTALETPRYFEAKQDIDRIDPYTLSSTADTIIKKGSQIKYLTKVETRNGWCFRTEHNTVNNITSCAPSSLLKEIDLNLDDVPNSEQVVLISRNSKKSQLRSGKDTTSFSNNLLRLIKKRVTVLGNTYYLTAYDLNNIDKAWAEGFNQSYIEKTGSYVEKDSYVRASSGAKKIDVLSGESVVSLKEGEERLVKATIELDGKKYYQTDYEYKKGNIDALLPAEVMGKTYTYERFAQPKTICLTTDAERINLETGEVVDTLLDGKEIVFSEKIVFEDGTTYYRTKHNAENNLFYGVRQSNIE